MAESLLLAWASPASQESLAEFDTWYDEVHIPELRAAIPSISRVQRFQLVDPANGPTGRYLAVYEMDDADVAAAAAALGGGVKSGRIRMTAAMDTAITPPVTQWYQAHQA
ncbi:DUF4286 family protein [Pseudonocardia kunmingensis]|uniref:EthD domain-containing protein n=1 Tax=Pseudonocardia kunmingensis TaxID=630975 RepID=A0A543DPE6_9PSEU|nr:DUF4286 family protein [Pseudonocardia kunmingensis]TQM11212.1 hypothetical protein FB558_3767 [Pseudonocardia kunmingensis]